MAAIAAIVTAIATGAAETTKLVIQDLYAAIKKRIQEKHPQANASLEALEKKPDSASKRESLKEDLQDSGADKDDDLLKQARALLTAIEEHAPQLAQAIGVNLEDVKAANLRLKEISVTGEQATGVNLSKGEFSGDIEIGSVKVGAQSTKKS